MYYLLLRDILDEAAAAKAAVGTNQSREPAASGDVAARGTASATPQSNKQKVGEFWRTAMDTAAIEKQGAQPLADDLTAIAKLQTAEHVAAFVRRHQVSGDLSTPTTTR